MKENKNIVLHGSGRLSQTVANMLRDKYKAIFLYVDSDYLDDCQHGTELPVISSLEEDLIGVDADYISTIGYKSMKARKLAYLKMCTSSHLNPVNIVHPTAYISSDANIGVGNIFFPGVIIEDGVTIGENNIFWSNSCICHDAVIGSHNFFAASTTVGGYSVIGDTCFLGFGSIVNENLQLADFTFTASGSVLVKSQLINGARMCGIPAREM